MRALCDSTVSRGGISQQRLVLETSKMSISASDTLDIEFSIASKEGGFTRICVEIGLKDFESLVEGMSATDRHMAMTAMSSELQRQIEAQPMFDEEQAKVSRASLLNRALDSMLAAGSDHLEDLRYAAYSEIKKLIEEVERG
jgi:hypothetical protein